jgi:serine/threonine protein kinase
MQQVVPLFNYSNNFLQLSSLILTIYGEQGVYKYGEEIAVKILRNTLDFDRKEFIKEFQILRGLKHQNVVELLGFCNESKEVVTEHEGKQIVATEIHTALCLEYVNNGSLQQHISGN